jgi:hypothetical protein
MLAVTYKSLVLQQKYSTMQGLYSSIISFAAKSNLHHNEVNKHSLTLPA